MTILTNAERQLGIAPYLMSLILLLGILMQTTTDLYLPSLPAITAAFHSTQSTIQLTLSIFMLGLGFSHIFYGPLSDRIGRKPPMLFGVGLSVFGSFLCFLAPNTGILILGRFFQGFGIGCCNSVGRSVLRDMVADSMLAKLGSYLGMVSIFIMALSPTLGGYIQEYFGWRANFLTLFIFGVIVWLFTWYSLPETNRSLVKDATRFKTMKDNYWLLLRHPVFMRYTLCSCIAFAGLASYFTVAPFLLQTVLGLSVVEFGWMSFFVSGAIFFSGLLNSFLVVKKGIPKMFLLGIVLMILGGSSMLLLASLGLTNLLSIMLPVSIFCMGAGLVFINAFAGAFNPFPNIAGTAAALYASMQDLSGSVACAIIASVKGNSQGLLAVILLTLGLLSLSIWTFLRNSEIA